MPDQKTILVIDDQDVICGVTRDILEDEGQYIVITYTRLPSMDCVVVHAPDLILLDVLLENTDGRAFCTDIRHDIRICTIPVLLFSVYNVDPVTVVECGANGFIRKPFDIDEFLSHIRQWTSQDVQTTSCC